MQDMSTISGILSPNSKMQTEITYSDYSDSYYDTYSHEKHTDSIISSEQAEKIQMKKNKIANSQASSNKTPMQVRLGRLREQAQEKFEEIFKQFSDTNHAFAVKLNTERNKHWSIASPLTPIKLLEKSQETKAKEDQILKDLKAKYEVKKNAIIKSYEDQKNKLIDNKRENLQKFWRTKMFELNGKLQQAEWKKNSKKNEEEQKIKSSYESLFKVALVKEKKLLEDEIDEHFKAQFDQKLKIIREEKGQNENNSGKEKIKVEIEAHQMIVLHQEKIKWEAEKPTIEKECLDKINLEIENKVNHAKNKVLMDVREEIDEILLEAQKEIDRETSQKLLSIKNNENNKILSFQQAWKDECEAEILDEKLFSSINSYKNNIKQSIAKEIRRGIYSHIENQVLKTQQDEIFTQISDEMSGTYERMRKEMENIYKKDFIQLQEAFHKDFQLKIKQESDKKIQSKEKECYIRYIQKLESFKNMEKSKFETNYGSEHKKTKEQLIKEKALLGQLKSKKNIQISKLDLEIHENLNKLHKEVLKLKLKLREVTQSCKIDDETTIETKEPHIKFPSKLFLHLSNPEHPQNITETPNSLPPSLSAKELKPRTDSAFKSIKPFTESTPKLHIDSEKNNKNQWKEPNSTKSLSYDNLKLKTKDKLRLKRLKQTVYHELLKQKYGFIQPRLNIN